MIDGVVRHFQQYFSFIGGGNQSTWRKPLTCRKLLKNYHIMLYRVHIVWTGFEFTTLVVIGTDYIGSYKSNYHTITTTSASITLGTNHLTFREAFCFLPSQNFIFTWKHIRFYLHEKISKHCSNLTHFFVENCRVTLYIFCISFKKKFFGKKKIQNILYFIGL